VEWRCGSAHSLAPVLDGGGWSVLRPGRFAPGEEAPVAHLMGVWVGPRAVLDAVVRRGIPGPCRESKPRTPIVQPVAQCSVSVDFIKRANVGGFRSKERENVYGCLITSILNLKIPRKSKLDCKRR